MTILVPPRAHANIACAVEGFSLSNTISGVQEVLTGTVDAVSAAADTIEVTVTAANMQGTPAAVNVGLALADTKPQVAAKIADALALDAGIAAWFDIATDGDDVVLVRKIHAANDPTMAIAVTADLGATGVTITDAITTPGSLATSCTITLTPDVTYAAVPALVGAPQHIKGVGSAATKIDNWAITTQAVGGVTITATLDAAPGAGITDTIVFVGGLIGIPAR